MTWAKSLLLSELVSSSIRQGPLLHKDFMKINELRGAVSLAGRDRTLSWVVGSLGQLLRQREERDEI